MSNSQIALSFLGFVVTILFGGVAGAVVKYLFDRQQNGIQVVAVNTQVTTTNLKPRNLPGKTLLKVSIHRDAEDIPVDKLFVAKITLMNEAKAKDFSTFDLKITLPGELTIIDEDIITPDQSHVAVRVNTPEDQEHLLDWPQEGIVIPPYSLDYQLKPFSRGNTYVLQLTLAAFRSRMVFEGNEPRLVSVVTRGTLDFQNLLVTTPEAGVKFRDVIELFLQDSQPSQNLSIVGGVILIAGFSLFLFPSLFVSMGLPTILSISAATISLVLFSISVFFRLRTRRNVDRRLGLR